MSSQCQLKLAYVPCPLIFLFQIRLDNLFCLPVLNPMGDIPRGDNILELLFLKFILFYLHFFNNLYFGLIFLL